MSWQPKHLQAAINVGDDELAEDIAFELRYNALIDNYEAPDLDIELDEEYE